MIKWKKYICVALSAVMMASLATGCGDTNDSSSSLHLRYPRMAHLTQTRKRQYMSLPMQMEMQMTLQSAHG